MPRTYCPECDAVISMADPYVGAQFRCPECNVELEVVSVDPFDIYFPFDEDWDEEWDDGDWDDDHESVDPFEVDFLEDWQDE